MKAILLIIFITSSLTHILAQDITFPAGTKPIEMVSKLFEGEINDEGVCVWKPNLAEKLQFHEHGDGLLYTQIDDVFAYYDVDNKYKNMLIVTYTKDNVDDNCYECSPGMSIIELKLYSSYQKLETFYKFVDFYGAWGSPGAVDLIKIADDDFCIQVLQVLNDTAQGQTTGTTTLYYKGKNILSFINSDDNKGVAGERGGAYEYEYTTTWVVDPDKKQIILYKKGTDLNKDGKAIKVDEVTRYEFIDGRFVKMCN